MCGLFGYSGLKRPSPQIIKLLWIYSTERGKDSTGIYKSGKIIKSWHDWNAKKTGNAYEYVLGTFFKPDNNNKINTVIGHTRSKTVGLVSKENTHPFEYFHNENRFIFAHNGTIKNITELAEKYGIAREGNETDSQTFGHILVEKGFDILLEYKGTAAFSLYNEAEDTLFLWRGFSKHESGYSNQIITASDERPLSIYTGKNVLYYASDSLNLVTAVNTNKNIKSLAPNTLYVIRGGEIIDTVQYDRSEVVSAEPSRNFPSYGHNYGSGYGSGYYSTEQYPKKKNTTKTTSTSVSKEIMEPSPQAHMGGRVYFWKGKYYKNGHPLTGTLLLDRDGNQVYQKSLGEIYYFHGGYLLKSKEVYDMIISQEIDIESAIIENIYDVSLKYIHPEALLIKYNKTYSNSWAFYGGNYCHNVEIMPLFGYYTYTFDGSGNISKIEKVNTISGSDDTDPIKNIWKNQFSV